ncbi:MAG TPA: hypothetical protein P5511_03705, partial [Candidatus Goldiibacteriota bacterium]|nr:hypothetical protein [Candidatus Goldiibacteriota bacterium]
KSAILDTDKLLALLKERAEKAGAVISEGENFKGYTRRRGSVAVKTDRNTYSALYLVDASGAGSSLQKKFSGALVRSGSMGCHAVELEGLKISDPESAVIFDAGPGGREYFWLLPYSRSAALAGCFFFRALDKSTAKKAKTALSAYIRYRKLGGRVVSTISGNIPLNARRYFSMGRVFFCGDSCSSPLPSSGYGLLRALDEAEILVKCAVRGFKKRRIDYSRQIALARYPGYELHYFVSDILKNIDNRLLDRAIRAMNDNPAPFIDNFMRGNDLSVVFAAKALAAILSAFKPRELASLAIRRDYREFLPRVSRDYPGATPEMMRRLIKWLVKRGVRDIIKGIRGMRGKNRTAL